MGSCFSKKASPSSSNSTIKPTDFNKSAIDNSTKPQEKLLLEQRKPTIESIQQTEPQENDEKTKKKEALLIQNHRRSHERSKTTTDQEEEEEDSTASDEKSTNSNHKTVDVDAILIQCGRMSRSNSAAAAVASSAAKTRRYSGSKRSFDFDQNNAEEADAEEEDESERRNRRNRSRGGGDSPRDRRRRTPSREREDSKSYRSGSRERVGGGGGSRRVSRSPGRRSDLNPNPNSSSAAVSGNSVNSNNNNKKPARFVSVPATEKINNNNGETSSNKRITVKRNNGGKAAATVAASPRSQSPARAASPRSQSPARATASYAQPSPSKLSRKTELSPYRRNPLVEIDTNSLTIQPQKKKMMNKESENTQKLSTKTATQALTRRTVSPSRVIKETVGEECKTVLSSKPQVMSRSRSLRKSRDFDFSPETLLSNNNVVVATGAAALPSSYTALLLEDIQNFHQKSVHVNAISSSVSKACSIIEAVSDLNSTTNQQSRTEFKSDLMEPSFEKYVTVKRGCVSSSLKEDMEAQQEESSGSNSYVVAQRHGNSWEPNSAESTDRVSVVVRSNKQEGEFDPLKKNGVDSCSSKQTKTTTTTSRVGVVSV
ncbi:unnamed protein product [Cochlearia groenlandica]